MLVLTYNCFVVNNLNLGPVVCDGNFTFEKGGRKSQNDLVIANQYSLSVIRGFKIHELGWNPSDHSPISINIDLDVTDRNIAVSASQDILYQQNSNKIRKPKKIPSEGIDWHKYKTLVENDYKNYDTAIQQLHIEPKLQTLDKSVNMLSDSLYRCASTLAPLMNNPDSFHQEREIFDPLVELADKTHADWKRGECSTLDRHHS